MNKRVLIKIALLAVVLVLLLNPGIFPFAEGTINAVKTEMSNHIGSVLGAGTGLLSPSKLIPAAAVIVLMWLVCTIALTLVDLVKTHKARALTVTHVVRSLIKYACFIIGTVWTLSILGVDLTAIFASLGILTLVIGFGAQSLIEDMVTGLFIILEGNYNIDDVIILDDFRGTVKKIGIRTTTIEDAGGNLKIVNNSDIRNIQNRSILPSVAICDIGICYEDDIRKVESAILPQLEGIYTRNPNLFKAAPEYKGVQDLADSSVVLRFTAYCDEADIFVATRMLKREMKILFDDNNISIPFPQLDVHAK